MIIIGLTGSIGMGKTTCGQMFARLGVPVHEADEAVHRILSQEGLGLQAVRSHFPYYEFPQIYGKKTKEGVRVIKRKALGELVFADDELRQRLEDILHPLVREDQQSFIRKHKARDMVVLDIPLLFETRADKNIDLTVVVSAPEHIQHQRVMSRPNMTLEKFEAILSRQMPDGEKRARADYVVPTGLGHAKTMQAVKQIVSETREKSNALRQPCNGDT